MGVPGLAVLGNAVAARAMRNKKNDHEQTPDQDHVFVWRDLPVGFEDPLRQIVVLEFVLMFALHGLSLVSKGRLAMRQRGNIPVGWALARLELALDGLKCILRFVKAYFFRSALAGIPQTFRLKPGLQPAHFFPRAV